MQYSSLATIQRRTKSGEDLGIMATQVHMECSRSHHQQSCDRASAASPQQQHILFEQLTLHSGVPVVPLDIVVKEAAE